MSTREEQLQQLEAIKAGQVLFTKTPTGWLVWGRTEHLTIGTAVKVTKLDGTTSTVIITSVGPAREYDGIKYAVAEFQAAPKTIPARRACTHDEADNRGICYGCGKYIRRADAFASIW